MRAIKLLITTACVLIGALPGNSAFGRPSASPDVTLQIIVDNSAALIGAEAEAFKRRLLFHVTELRKQRKFKHAHLNVVTTNNPRNAFVGTPVDLFRSGARLLGDIAVVEKGCADLVGALEQVKLNLELSTAKDAYVLIFWSGIHTGAPCNVSITLPQAVPSDLDLSFLAKETISVRMYWLHNLQVRPWLQAIKEAGLKNAKVFDVETSKAVLNKGLGHE